MPAIDEDDRPKKKITHEIGQELTLLSVGELTERVALLKEEIARLEANMATKQASQIRGRPVLQEVSGAGRQKLVNRALTISDDRPVLNPRLSFLVHYSNLVHLLGH